MNLYEEMVMCLPVSRYLLGSLIGISLNKGHIYRIKKISQQLLTNYSNLFNLYWPFSWISISDWLTNNLHILHVSMFWVPLKSMWRRVSHLVTPCLERMYGRHTDMFTCKYIFYIKCDAEPEWKKIVCNFFLNYE